MKCHLNPGQYLELSVQVSPLKHWIICGNSVGIIDADYCDNPDNEGEILLQLVNLSPFAIQLKRGDKIGQGIIKSYGITDNDAATGERLADLETLNDSSNFGSKFISNPPYIFILNIRSFMKKYKVYLFIFPNGKFYCGYTS